MRIRLFIIAALTAALLTPALMQADVQLPPRLQDSPGGPGTSLPPTKGLPPPMVLAPSVPTVVLSPRASNWLKDRMRAHVAHKLSVAPRVADLTAAGLSAENDFVEQARTVGAERIAPFNVGQGTIVPPAAAPPVQEVDPAIQQSARAALRQRLRREPTAAEVVGELRAFDARVAQINQALAARHAEIATAMRQDGRFPRALEAPFFGVAPGDPQAQSPAARSGFMNVLARLIESQAASSPGQVAPATPMVVPTVPVPLH